MKLEHEGHGGRDCSRQGWAMCLTRGARHARHCLPRAHRLSSGLGRVWAPGWGCWEMERPPAPSSVRPWGEGAPPAERALLPGRRCSPDPGPGPVTNVHVSRPVSPLL